jgi:hypothetical protein
VNCAEVMAGGRDTGIGISRHGIAGVTRLGGISRTSLSTLSDLTLSSEIGTTYRT